jgi:thiol:disulfide interchange protein DsbD
MPCVFPVLALKALALVELAREERAGARIHAVAYATGVLVAFWVLAGALLALRSGGAQLGWGFQLQRPAFVAFLAGLLFWMALVLLDVCSIGTSIMGVGSGLASRRGYGGSFFTGVLATVVATPCTAPFMGAAIGYALVQPPATALAVFTCLALGLALPYVVLSLVPVLAARLPRPGPWMETTKQLLAFPLLATVVWLVWVTSLQGGPETVLRVLTVLLMLGFAAWMLGRWPRGWARVVAVVTVVCAAGIAASLDAGARSSESATPLVWESYSPARMSDLERAGRPVFLDFTAAWCVTCQVNERVALTARAVTEKMREIGVVPVRADWTKSDPEIARALQRFGRDGVPLYVLYSGRHDDPPRILPQLLTSRIVLDELEKLETRS